MMSAIARPGRVWFPTDGGHRTAPGPRPRAALLGALLVALVPLGLLAATPSTAGGGLARDNSATAAWAADGAASPLGTTAGAGQPAGAGKRVVPLATHRRAVAGDHPEGPVGSFVATGTRAVLLASASASRATAGPLVVRVALERAGAPAEILELTGHAAAPGRHALPTASVVVPLVPGAAYRFAFAPGARTITDAGDRVQITLLELP